MASNLKFSNREVEGEQCASTGKTYLEQPTFRSLNYDLTRWEHCYRQSQLLTDSNPFNFEISVSIQVANEKTLEKKVARVLDNPTIR